MNGAFRGMEVVNALLAQMHRISECGLEGQPYLTFRGDKAIQCPCTLLTKKNIVASLAGDVS